MERTLIAALEDLEYQYQCARFRHRLLQEGVVSLADFKRWLQENTQPEEYAVYVERNRIGKEFLGGRDTQEAESVRREKALEVLHTDAAILYAVDMIEQGRVPSHRELAGFVEWVEQYRQPIHKPKPSLTPLLSRGQQQQVASGIYA